LSSLNQIGVYWKFAENRYFSRPFSDSKKIADFQVPKQGGVSVSLP